MTRRAVFKTKSTSYMARVLVSRCSPIDFKLPINVFAQIESGPNCLLDVGKRILMQGAEVVSFSLETEDA